MLKQQKVFDLLTGEVIAQFHGHDEEVLCIKHAQYKGEHYLVSTSQDGYIIQWKVDSEWRYVFCNIALIQFAHY